MQISAKNEQPAGENHREARKQFREDPELVFKYCGQEIVVGVNANVNAVGRERRIPNLKENLSQCMQLLMLHALCAAES